MLDGDLGIFIDAHRRYDIQVQRTLLDAVLDLGVWLAAATHESRVIAVRPRVNANLRAVARQSIEEDEGPGPLRVLSTLRMRGSVLRAQHVLAPKLDHWRTRW